MMTTTQKRGAKTATPDRLKAAKKNLSEIQKILRQYTPAKKIETVSTAGTWKDASQIMWDKEAAEKFCD